MVPCIELQNVEVLKGVHDLAQIVVFIRYISCPAELIISNENKSTTFLFSINKGGLID